MNQDIATVAHVLRVLEVTFAVVTRNSQSAPKLAQGSRNISGFNSRPVGHPNHDVFAALDPGADVFCKSGIVFRNRHAGFGGFECGVVVGDELAREVNGSLWDQAVVVHKDRDHVIELPTDIANFFGQGSHVVDAVSMLAARTLTRDGAKY